MQEEWVPIPGFPNYAVSSEGRVINLDTELIKKASLNQNGVAHVLLMRDHEQFRRSVANLVATAFIERPEPRFDTPIHLNGDPTDNRVENLTWRPRWYARRRNRQFMPGYISAIDEPVQDVHSLEVYDNSLHAAIVHGLVDIEVFMSVLNRTIVFPTNQQFQLYDQ